MEQRSIFENLSPLDHRYYLANKSLFEDLSKYLSERAVITYCIRAEAALLKTHVDLFFGGSEEEKRAVETAAAQITPEEVYREEEKTKHNIRALVNVMKRYVPEALQPYVHLGATSVDVLDTSAAMRIRDVTVHVVLPLLVQVENLLCGLTAENADVLQTGRTHGQRAVPVTLGFTFAEYASRLGKSIIEIRERVRHLKGKLAGAVGAYNATSLLVKDPMEMERTYLAYLGLEPSEHSTQMVEPEYLLRVLLEFNTAFGIIANLADDLRNLQRSEIAELQEFFSSTQVGSSTMPQKRNPWNSEHVKSLWKAFAPRALTFFMDQISEHQRDLTNSASSRFVADYISGFCAAAERMRRVLESLHVDTEQLRKNVMNGGEMLLAEAAYILLSTSGEKEGHEKIRIATLKAEKEKQSLKICLKEDPDLWTAISTKLYEITGLDADAFFSDPGYYIGQAGKKARSISEKYTRLMKMLTKELAHGN